MCYIIKTKSSNIETVGEYQKYFKKLPIVSLYARENDLSVYSGSCLCMVDIPKSLEGLKYVQDESNLTIELI